MTILMCGSRCHTMLRCQCRMFDRYFRPIDGSTKWRCTAPPRCQTPLVMAPPKMWPLCDRDILHGSSITATCLAQSIQKKCVRDWDRNSAWLWPLTHAAASAAAQWMRQLETLQAIAIFSLFAHYIQHAVNQFSTLGVMTLGPIVTWTKKFESKPMMHSCF